MKELRLIVVTPEKAVHDAAVEFVVLPLYDGELGIARDHSPMIGRLGYGEMRITAAGQVRRFYVDGGFVQVADNVVSVLSSRAIPATELDAEVAAEQLSTAQRMPAHTTELMLRRERAIAQSRAQLRVAQRA